MSAQKQCPKCGEKNPAEAVMCWACYTSLSGGAAAPAVGGPAGGGAMAGAIAGGADAGGEKKKLEPKQLAIIGVGLLVVLGFAAKTLMGGGGGGGDDQLPTFDGSSSMNTQMNPPSGGGTTNQAPIGAGPAAGGAAPGAPTTVAGATPFPYKMVAGPNPQIEWATMGIVPNQGALAEPQARGLASFAHHYQEKVKKFPAWEIFVINNEQAAQAFAKYQNDRRGQRMGPGDYQSSELMNVWAFTPVRYVSVNGKVTYSSPQKNPTGFWRTSAG